MEGSRRLGGLCELKLNLPLLQPQVGPAEAEGECLKLPTVEGECLKPAAQPSQKKLSPLDHAAHGKVPEQLQKLRVIGALSILVELSGCFALGMKALPAYRYESCMSDGGTLRKPR